MKICKRNRAHDSKALLAFQENIKKCSLLTDEEEQTLGERILQGDMDARNKLAEANLALVFKCANDYRNPRVPMDELVAAGNLGLTIAATRFDPAKGLRFCFYAIHYVKDAIRRAIADYVSSVRVPRGTKCSLCFESINPFDSEQNGDEDWVRPLIDTLSAAPEYWENQSVMKDLIKEAHDIMGNTLQPFDVNLILDYAQKLHEGFTIKDLAYEYNLPLKKIKKLVAEIQLKARALKLQLAFKNAA